MQFYIELPRRIDAGEEGEFDSIAHYFKSLNPELKVKKIGYTGSDCTGIIYVGSLKLPENRRMVKRLKLDVEEFEEEC